MVIVTMPIAITGRAIELHPAIEAAFRQALIENNFGSVLVQKKLTRPHIAAANVASKHASALPKSVADAQ